MYYIHVHAPLPLYRWSTVRVTMQGRSAWWSVIREQCILEESTRREREESQVSGVWLSRRLLSGCGC